MVSLILPSASDGGRLRSNASRRTGVRHANRATASDTNITCPVGGTPPRRLGF
jgi:hypothetical protein